MSGFFFAAGALSRASSQELECSLLSVAILNFDGKVMVLDSEGFVLGLMQCVSFKVFKFYFVAGKKNCWYCDTHRQRVFS